MYSSARDDETDEKVAIKKIGNAFDNVVDSRRVLREIKLLRHLQHENVIAIKDIMRPPNKDNFQDVYIVYELMDTDLHQIIRSSQPLSDDHCQYFIYQVLFHSFGKSFAEELRLNAVPISKVTPAAHVCPLIARYIVFGSTWVTGFSL